jgi:two-component system NtrC family response regulator
VRGRAGAPPVVVLTAFATAANTIEAMRLGAFGHLTKPIGRQELATLLERMLPKIDTTVAKKALETDDILIGSSEAMRTVQKAIGLLADGDATVLTVGDTGTGKELIARALHNLGRVHRGQLRGNSLGRPRRHPYSGCDRSQPFGTCARKPVST